MRINWLKVIVAIVFIFSLLNWEVDHHYKLIVLCTAWFFLIQIIKGILWKIKK